MLKIACSGDKSRLRCEERVKKSGLREKVVVSGTDQRREKEGSRQFRKSWWRLEKEVKVCKERLEGDCSKWRKR